MAVVVHTIMQMVTDTKVTIWEMYLTEQVLSLKQMEVLQNIITITEPLSEKVLRWQMHPFLSPETCL